MAETTVGPARSSETSLSKKSASLIRGMGFLAILAFGVNAISLSAAGQLPFASVAGLWPGGNLTLILLLAVVLSLFHAYTYAVIGSAAPRSGADYFIASRVLSAPLAFASSWTLVIFSGLVAGSLIAGIPQHTLPMIFRTLSLITNERQLMVLADTVAAPENVVLIGTVCVVLVFMTLILSQRAIVRFLQVGLVLGLLAWGIIYFQLLSVPINIFPSAWNTYMGSGDYLDRIIQARALGMDYAFDRNGTTLAGLILGFWIFYGYFIPTYFAGEVKNPGKNLLLGSLASLLLAGGIFVGAVYLLNRLVPSEWLAAESFLYLNPAYKGISMPWITFYAAVLRPNLALIIIVSIAWVFTLFNLAQTYFFYMSRIVLAWADDGLMPEVVSYVHPVMRSPLMPVLFAAIIAELGVVDASLNGVLSAQINFVFFVVLTQLVPVAAITLLPFLKRDWFESASPLVRLKLGPIPVITLVGLLTLVYLVWLAVAYIIYPVLGGVQTGTLMTFSLLFISGIAWFFGRKAYLKSLGHDLSLQPGKSPAD